MSKNLRNLDCSRIFVLAGSEEVSAAKEMVKKMSTKYYPDAIANPTLQRYYAELEGLALERTALTEVVDHTRKFSQFSHL